MKLSLLINMKMPTIVGIFIFISREKYVLRWVEHEKSFITSGPSMFRWSAGFVMSFGVIRSLSATYEGLYPQTVAFLGVSKYTLESKRNGYISKKNLFGVCPSFERFRVRKIQFPLCEDLPALQNGTEISTFTVVWIRTKTYLWGV